MGDLISAYCNWGLEQGEGTHGCSHQWLAQHGPLSSSPAVAPEGLSIQISKAAHWALHGLGRQQTCPRRAEMWPAPGDPAAMVRPAAAEAGTGSSLPGTW